MSPDTWDDQTLLLAYQTACREEGHSLKRINEMQKPLNLVK